MNTRAYRGAPPSVEGRFPLVIFSHGFGGYRQISSLAAHFVVIANGGHAALVDLCPARTGASGLLVRLTPWLGSVTALSNGCGPGYPEAQDVWSVLRHLSVAHLYEVFWRHDVGVALSETGADAVSRAELSAFETKPCPSRPG